MNSRSRTFSARSFSGRPCSGRLTSRRKFLAQTAAAAIGLSIVPRRVLGGAGFVPPSDKVNIAFIETSAVMQYLTMRQTTLCGKVISVKHAEWSLAPRSFRVSTLVNTVVIIAIRATVGEEL